MTDDGSGMMVTTRSVRANRGTLLKQMLEQGFDSEEEEVLKAAESSDDVWSEPGSSSFSTQNNTDTDFSDEEDAGRMSSATSESDDARAAERQRREELRDEKQRKAGPVRGAVEHRITLQRAAPTIPLKVRMERALQRAAEVVAADEATSKEAAAASEGDVPVQALLATLHRGRKRRRREAADGRGVTAAQDDEPRTMWSSSAALLARYGSPVVISFSHGLPPMFSGSTVGVHETTSLAATASLISRSNTR